tara:strand:- start:1430 stop:1831 length:402 start_codon:yes stop_codon:yes gene_type:complete
MTTEAGLYKQLKTANKSRRNWTLTRIENWIGQGIPDLLACDENGGLHFIELKFCKANAVNLSPHQVAWLTRHRQSSSWVLVKRQSKAGAKATLHLYSASQAIALAEDGLKTTSAGDFEHPFDWTAVFQLISPI